MNVSHLLGDDYIGLEEVAADIWSVYFGPVHLGWRHVGKSAILTHDGSPRREKRKGVTHQPREPFTHQPRCSRVDYSETRPRFANTTPGITKLVARLKDAEPELVVLEATGRSTC